MLLKCLAVGQAKLLCKCILVAFEYFNTPILETGEQKYMDYLNNILEENRIKNQWCLNEGLGILFEWLRVKAC